MEEVESTKTYFLKFQGIATEQSAYVKHLPCLVGRETPLALKLRTSKLGEENKLSINFPYKAGENAPQ